jgi:predicted alpha/beta-fold hydrolase
MANGHLQSIIPSVFRQVSVPYKRSRLELDDGDFLDLDELPTESAVAPLVIISHGLEGSSNRPYVKGMARHFHDAGWQVIAWNFRSCSGEMNRLPRFYHSGAINDLKAVIDHALKRGVDRIFLVGFSMGGNQTVLTLAEPDLPDQVVGGATFSVPLDLEACAHALAKPAQRIYMRRFLRDLKDKIADKAERFPDRVSLDGYEEIRNFKQFDDRYTGPLHGYRDAEDYWHSCSSGAVLDRLRRPTLVVNALDDPFLAAACYRRPSKASSNLLLETPMRGGHVGFMRWRLNRTLWSEYRALAFARSILKSGQARGSIL